MVNTMTHSSGRLTAAFFLTLALVVLMPEIASAAMPDSITNALCNIVMIINNGVAKGLATLAIIFLGLGAMLGKVSWGTAVIVAAGIGVVFGAGGISTLMGAGNVCAGLPPGVPGINA